MVSVKIGPRELSLSEVNPHWIEQQINGNRREGTAFTVVVRVQVDGVNLCFVAPPPPGGPGREYSARETAIIELWMRCGMNRAGFSPGDLIAFLKQLPRLLP